MEESTKVVSKPGASEELKESINRELFDDDAIIDEILDEEGET